MKILITSFFTICSLLVLAQSNTPLSVNNIPPGYYTNAENKTCSILKTALFNIISTGTNQLVYTPGVWNAYATTDLHRNDANNADVIWDIYSDNPTGPEAFYYTLGTDQCGTYNSEGDCYNREHSFPQAWFGSGTYPMFSDVHHVFPTDGFTNGKHDNNPYSEVATASWTSVNGSKLGTNAFPGFTGTVFEPINEYKGDIARATLYMITRYEGNMVAWQTNGNANDILNGTTYPSLDAWYVKLLYKWHTQDPPSQKEISRNNAIYALQNNRNPFVDRPEFVALIWQCTGLIPVTLLDFKATHGQNNILLNWSTTQETSGFKQYEIERSTDGTRFNNIGIVAGQNLANYGFTDAQLPASTAVFYRLKMIDVDGKFKYSKIVTVRLRNDKTGILVFPNPANNNLSIKLQQAILGNATIVIRDITGRTMLQQNINNAQQLMNINTEAFPSGRYFIALTNRAITLNETFVITR
jgi:endonuclease I